MAADPVNGFARAVEQPPLGTILVQNGVLSPEQLEEALDEQQRTGERLGAILVRLGFIQGASVALGLAAQQGGALKTEYGYAVSLRSSVSAAGPPQPPPITAPEAAPLRLSAPVPAAGTVPVSPPAPPALAAVLGPQPDTVAALERVAQLERELATANALIAELRDDRPYLLELAERDREHSPEEHAADSSHLVFAPVAAGYMLFECAGPPPANGTTMGLRQADGSVAELLVAKVAAPPLPGISLGCAYLVDAD